MWKSLTLVVLGERIFWSPFFLFAEWVFFWILMSLLGVCLCVGLIYNYDTIGAFPSFVSHSRPFATTLASDIKIWADFINFGHWTKTEAELLPPGERSEASGNLWRLETLMAKIWAEEGTVRKNDARYPCPKVWLTWLWVVQLPYRVFYPTCGKRSRPPDWSLWPITAFQS